MPSRLALFCAVALFALSGCAQNDVANIGAVDGHMDVAGRATAEPTRLAAHIPTSGGPIAETGGLTTNAIADGEEPYLLDTGDRLRVFVYGQPNLSRLYPVDQSGKITIPLIGPVKARGLTTAGLEHEIRDRLAGKFVRDPQVTVDVAQNRPFFILGEVRNAGQYPYVSGMTVETAVAIGGGYTERADDTRFRISRRTDGGLVRFDVPAGYALKPGDTVFVYERFL